VETDVLAQLARVEELFAAVGAGVRRTSGVVFGLHVEAREIDVVVLGIDRGLEVHQSRVTGVTCMHSVQWVLHNSAFHPSCVGKRGQTVAGKAEAGMVRSVRG